MLLGGSEVEKQPNQLIDEKSPYLLQHAYNPVDWHPWGEEAFKKARDEQKPIFLSIGYSTCHWCHVMEEESFSNPDIAKIMNEHFVSIKVDREERPDVDHVYMGAVMRMTGSGGWPLSAFLTPDLKPFFGGTYFPPDDRWGRPGFATVLQTIAQRWKDNRAQILSSGDIVTSALQTEMGQMAGISQDLGISTLQRAYEELRGIFDEEDGGFGSAPKFPRSHALSFLLRYWKRTGESHALSMVEQTLQAMARGGMYDHLGGGFHRYSTDAKWRVPHFEKMLYDQAILAKTYLEAYQATRNPFYERIAREVFEYVLRDLSDKRGAFHSAEDADSAADAARPRLKSEGAFYIWSEAELASQLKPEEMKIFRHYYGIQTQGNALHDPHGEFGGKNILFAAHNTEDTAAATGKKPHEVEETLKEARRRLSEIRNKRLRPHLDDKILTDWNGLMISSLAFGARVLKDERYKKAAQAAADFILKELKTKDGQLLHRYRDGEAAITGFIEDYAFFTHGLFDLYEATYDPRYLEEASAFLDKMRELFWDSENGGFFFTPENGEALITRSKEVYDGAIPSGNSVAALSLMRVGRLTMNREMENLGQSTLDAFSRMLERSPSNFPQMLMALDFAVGPTREVVIAGDEQAKETQALIEIVHERFLPNKVSALRPASGPIAEQIVKISPFLKEQLPLKGQSTVYVCKQYVCDLPTTDPNKLKRMLEEA